MYIHRSQCKYEVETFQTTSWLHSGSIFIYGTTIIISTFPATVFRLFTIFTKFSIFFAFQKFRFENFRVAVYGEDHRLRFHTITASRINREELSLF